MSRGRSLAELPPDERKALAKKAGKASGEARRKRRKLRDELVLLLQEKDIQKQLCTALIEEALRGNVRAFVVIRDTLGEKPVDAFRVAGAGVMDDLTDSQREKLTLVYLEELRSGEASGISDLLPMEDKTEAAALYMQQFERREKDAKHR